MLLYFGGHFENALLPDCNLCAAPGQQKPFDGRRDSGCGNPDPRFDRADWSLGGLQGLGGDGVSVEPTVLRCTIDYLHQCVPAPC